jgi:hypothetical protein
MVKYYAQSQPTAATGQPAHENSPEDFESQARLIPELIKLVKLIIFSTWAAPHSGQFTRPSSPAKTNFSKWQSHFLH